jgi:hypothetical protein
VGVVSGTKSTRKLNDGNEILPSLPLESYPSIPLRWGFVQAIA